MVLYGEKGAGSYPLPLRTPPPPPPDNLELWKFQF